MRMIQTIKWLTRWDHLKQQDGETNAEFAIRVANDGKVICLWFAIGTIIVIAGLAYVGCK